MKSQNIGEHYSKTQHIVLFPDFKKDQRKDSTPLFNDTGTYVNNLLYSKRFIINIPNIELSSFHKMNAIDTMIVFVCWPKVKGSTASLNLDAKLQWEFIQKLLCNEKLEKGKQKKNNRIKNLNKQKPEIALMFNCTVGYQTDISKIYIYLFTFIHRL